MKHLIWILGFVLLLAGCRTSRPTVEQPQPVEKRCLSSKLQVILPQDNGTLKIQGTLKMVEDDRIQFSLLMPILRTELLRVELTRDSALVIDRLQKQYVYTHRDALQRFGVDEHTFFKLQDRLFQSITDNPEVLLTGSDFGFPVFDAVKVRLYDHSTTPIELFPTSPSPRYRQVDVRQLLDSLQL